MILPDSPEVVAQIAEIYEEQGDLLQALEWYQTLVSISPTDPDALAHTAELYDKENDKSLAYQHMLEVSWSSVTRGCLGSYSAVIPLLPIQPEHAIVDGGVLCRVSVCGKSDSVL